MKLFHRFAPSFIAAGIASTALAQQRPAPGTPVAFYRNDAIYLYNPADQKTQKIADGIFPAVSPDGTRVAFTSVQPNGSHYIRHMAVVALADGKVTMFNDMSSDNV